MAVVDVELIDKLEHLFGCGMAAELVGYCMKLYTGCNPSQPDAATFHCLHLYILTFYDKITEIIICILVSCVECYCRFSCI